jgi:23S rRNA pseudouridine1911/1915/1917 synthase
VAIRYLDQHLVVVEKPSGLATVRHPLERDWPERRKALSPTLEDIVVRLINKGQAAFARRRQKGSAPRSAEKRQGANAPRAPRLRVVHRLDKETSGLVVFARTVPAERSLGKQFHAHSVLRRYLALVPGYVPEQTIESFLVRDRGDGRRGSSKVVGSGKKAITHVEVVERLAAYTLLSCRLDTGRTHQIRIHLAELGHPVCGEEVYNRRPDGRVTLDQSGVPRLALHATELGFAHPVSGQPLHWKMDLPDDLQRILNCLRGRKKP